MLAVPRGMTDGSKEPGIWALVTEMLSKTSGEWGELSFPKSKTSWRWQKATDAERHLYTHVHTRSCPAVSKPTAPADAPWLSALHFAAIQW